MLRTLTPVAPEADANAVRNYAWMGLPAIFRNRSEKDKHYIRKLRIQEQFRTLFSRPWILIRQLSTAPDLPGEWQCFPQMLAFFELEDRIEFYRYPTKKGEIGFRDLRLRGPAL
jgi:hypothetical protein